MRAGKEGYGFGHHCHCTSFAPCPSLYRYYSFNSDLAESVSFRRETVSEDDVLLIAHELGPLWKKVGLVLKVPKAVISQIEANKSEVFEKCHSKCNCVVSTGNRTEWKPIRSVIIRVINQDYGYRQNWTTQSPIINS